MPNETWKVDNGDRDAHEDSGGAVATGTSTMRLEPGWYAGVIVKGTEIARNSTINSATLRLHNSTAAATFSGSVFCFLNDTSNFSGGSSDPLSGRMASILYTDFSETGYAETWLEVDVAPIVQALVNTAARSELGFLIDSNSGFWRVDAYDSSPALAAELVIDWTEPSPTPPTETYTALIDRFIGEIIAMVVPFAPLGCYLADGSILLVEDHPVAALVFSNHFGGDGVTTFGLPDYRDRFLIAGGGLYPIGATGGSADIDLTHGHAFSVSTDQYTHDHNDLDGSNLSGISPVPGSVSGYTPVFQNGQVHHYNISDDTHRHIGSGVTDDSIGQIGILPPYGVYFPYVVVDGLWPYWSGDPYA